MNLLNSKKGGLFDYILPILILFGFAFMVFFARLFFDNFFSIFDTLGINSPAATKAIAGFTGAMNLFDSVGALLLIVFIIAIAISSYKVAAPPVFFVIMFVFSFFLGFISYFINYLFVKIVETGIFNTVTSHYPILILLCSNLHWVSLFLVVIGSITLYSKKDQGQYV